MSLPIERLYASLRRSRVRQFAVEDILDDRRTLARADLTLSCTGESWILLRRCS
ncbi:hypothetical protein Y024_5786 [Burkholderia pseudomallei TSV44]|nr:hypothetical protein Y024_5786 [Burkholderia pseudomallei TSV44]